MATERRPLTGEEVKQIEAFAATRSGTHYAVLGLPDGSVPEEVEQAYHDLVRRWHPDRFYSRDTGEYAAIIDGRSELVIGASATPAIDALTIAALGAAFDEDARTAWTFADCNLPAAVLAALLEDRRAGGPPLAVDAASTAKAQRLPPDLHGLDLLFLNADEAAAPPPW